MVVDLKTQIQEAMKMAMRSHAKERLGVIRLILAAIKQQEVDKRIQLSEEQVLEILAKMVKQRKESIVQFQPAGREDLIAKENFEIFSCFFALPSIILLILYFYAHRINYITYIRSIFALNIIIF